MITNAEKIKETPIVDVAAKYADLKKKGPKYEACCPFHTEKSPSFVIDPVRNRYKCFGCGKGGNNAAQFLIDLKGLEYPDALIEVAGIAGITVEQDHTAKAEPRVAPTIYDELLRAQHVLETSWPTDIDDDTEVTIANDRTLRFETMRHFGITIPTSDVVKAAASLGEVAKVNATAWRDRASFAIRDRRGRVVAWSGRDTTGNAKAKYWNSPDTPHYHKGNIVYGLFENGIGINKIGRAILVEGAMDVVSLYNVGVRNAVAGLGTAFTEAQAKALHAQTEEVLICYDGDEAGKKAAIKAIDQLLAVGMDALKIMTLPDGHDPDSYVREHGKDAFIDQCTKAQPAIVWAIVSSYDGADPFSKVKAIENAAELLRYVNNNVMRDSIIEQVCTQKLLGKAAAKQIRERIKQKDEVILAQQKRADELSPEQMRDIVTHGIYAKNNRYFISNDPDIGGGKQVSNFIINPIMLVLGSETSQRLVQVTNDDGDTFTEAIDSEVFVEHSTLKKVLEARGNFLYRGKPEDYLCLKSLVYSTTPSCTAITTKGWHSAGFLAWRNCLTLQDGTVAKPNEFGIVQVGDKRYFLKEMSKIKLDGGDDDDNDNTGIDYQFSFDTVDQRSFEYWSNEMAGIYGDNGMVAVAGYLLSIYRDVIFMKVVDYFPILFWFGPPGSGKSSISWCLQNIFGIYTPPFLLPAGTDVGFFRRMARARSFMVWYDEYKNSAISPKRAGAIKGTFDGSGHEKGVKDNTNDTITTRTKSMIVMSGQDQPTADVAMYERCLLRSFAPARYDDAHMARHNAFRDEGRAGTFTWITAHLQQYRERVSLMLGHVIDEYRTAIKPIARTNDVKDRILNNHLLYIAIVVCLDRIWQEDIAQGKAAPKLGFNVNRMIDVLVQNMITQSAGIATEDETTTFWRYVEYLLANSRILHYEDVIISLEKQVTVKGKNETTHTVQFEQPKKLVFIRLTKAHPEYMLQHRQQRNVPGLDVGALTHYLTTSPAYIGTVKAKKFKEANTFRTKSCLVFDADKLTACDFPFSKDIAGEGSTEEDDAAF